MVASCTWDVYTSVVECTRNFTPLGCVWDVVFTGAVRVTMAVLQHNSATEVPMLQAPQQYDLNRVDSWGVHQR
jgi:hypothetical protein